MFCIFPGPANAGDTENVALFDAVTLEVTPDAAPATDPAEVPDVR